MVINQREYRVCALQRSGHHAVVFWLFQQLEGTGCFLNNCRPGFSPYGSATLESLYRGIDPELHRQGFFTPKAFLIHNYEDVAPAAIAYHSYLPVQEYFVGHSAQLFDLLILRDPFNLFASKLRWARGQHRPPTLEHLRTLPELWKRHAHEFLSHTAFLKPGGTIRINYNLWCRDLEYRRRLAALLGITFTDDGFETIAPWGPNMWGDSFDNCRYAGAASQMATEQRWRHFAQDEFYLSLLQDVELWQLADAVFGPLPGTEVLRREV